MSAQDAILRLHSNAASGLPAEEAARRLASEGPNEIPHDGPPGPWRILIRQCASIMPMVLVAAVILSAISGDFKDAIAILAMLLLTVLLGFVQEYRAEKAMAALAQAAAPVAQVLRGGNARLIPARELVRGDIVLIEAGALVPADLRLIEAHALKIAESALTGESQPSEKNAAAELEEDIASGDRVNLAYLGTMVASGRGLGLVVATGPATEIGKIAGILKGQRRQPTPLQTGLEQAGRKLVAIALGVVALVFLEGWLRGEDLRLMLLTSISLAVAAVPEGLPAVVTIVLALGSQRMLARKALIRRLAAVETLGSVTVICSDKTGTLTQNWLSVEQIYTDGKWIGAENVQGDARALLALAALCTDVTHAGSGWMGDPTEIALVQAAQGAGLDKRALEPALPRESEIPFDSERKLMTTVHRLKDPAFLKPLVPHPGETRVVITKGAAEAVLRRAVSVWSRGSIQPLNDQGRFELARVHDEAAQRGLRVLAVAFRFLTEDIPRKAGENLESGLTFLGLFALMDPPRPEAAEAVRTTKQAGIRTVMVTGDHALTARRIAADLGIGGGQAALTGAWLRQLAERGDTSAILVSGVIARVSPQDKLVLVEALQRAGHVVAMTGDGANDAPALLRADVGVAMGQIGTDAARAASDMVLQDDNFSTIVAAVEEGRIIGSNIRKFVRLLLSANSGELFLMLLGPWFGIPLPLTPLQILWINLLTDGLPALALAAEPASPDIMRRGPSSIRRDLLNTPTVVSVLAHGAVLGLAAFLTGLAYMRAGDPAWQTVVFSVAVFGQLYMALGYRSEIRSLFRIGWFTNRAMNYALPVTAGLQFAMPLTSWGRRIFDLQPMDPGTYLAVLGVSAAPLISLEIEKYFRRRQPRR
jgi:Ca2+-transporting ATPase